MQVSTDQVSWQTISTVATSDDRVLIELDLSEFIGHVVWVRFVFDAVAPATQTDETAVVVDRQRRNRSNYL